MAERALIVGLGNPGSRYANTRHNAGFMVVDRLAERYGIAWRSEKGPSLLGWGQLEGCPAGLMKPLTYMNRSGAAVAEVVRYYRIPLERLLVVYDDIHLPPGRIRLRPGGSAGGHNGVEDIIRALGTTAFPRLRIGIGSNFERGRQADYVLSPFTREEWPLIDEALERACRAAVTFACEGIEAAMNRYNRVENSL
ncbi:aminoacyl-tRNA hydrolase [Rhodothermus marinus]|uniref:aminoacyl-tRNA hydrolase n=1 Tax=Rhodothermus marinus TaxID=29549 RepID=UPI0037C87653